MGRPTRSSTISIIVLAALVLGTGTAPLGPGTTKPPQQQTPVFRAGTHFVQVDAYPRRDGKIVEGLTAGDFEILEDGAKQTIESAEFIRVDLNTPEAERRDPNSQREGNELAADPRNRVFVLYLDHFHASLAGSNQLRRPMIDMLNRMLSPTDLFSVATVFTQPRDLIFGRRTTSLEAHLETHWTWGLKTTKSIDFEPEEQIIEKCYGEGPAAWYARRTREDRTLDTLSKLTAYLATVREARKTVIIFSKGWPLARPDHSVPEQVIGLETAKPPRVGVARGKLSSDPTGTRGVADWSRCNSELSRVASLDNRRKFFDLLELANRSNVTFYGVNPDGLTVRQNDVLRTLSNNTDGFTAETNDLSELLRRIADDVAAYYVLGYYTSNNKFDGRFRKIEVKVRQPGLTVVARRGYTAPVIAAPSSMATAVVKPPAPEGLESAIGALSRLRPSAELFTFAAPAATDVVVVAELASQVMTSGEWSKGADIFVSVTDAVGAVQEARGRIEAGQRAAMLRLPRPGGAAAFKVSVRAVAGVDELRDGLDVLPASGELLAAPLLFRASPSGQAPLRPVADLQFRRTERVHIEWPVRKALDRRDARLLSRAGTPLAVPVTVTERAQGGSQVLAADLNLAPLTAGDYVVEVTVGAGDKTERNFVAIRVRQ